MIEKLTKDQQKKVPVYLNKWLKKGYRTKTVDKKLAKKAVNLLYEKILKIDKPKYVIFLDSPMACQLAANLIKNTKLDSTRLDSQLDSQLRSQLRSQLDSQLDSQLGSQLRSQLYSQLRSQLYSQLGSQLGSQLRSQLDSHKLEYFGWCVSLWWWPGWTGFYDYLLNEVFPENKKEFKLFTEFLDVWPELHYYLAFKEIVFISDFPKAIRINERHQMHSFDNPSLEYRDTYGLHYSNGVKMKKEYIETPADKITKEMFLNETNVDCRREISRKLGITKTVEMLGAETVDTYKSKVGGKYELLMIDFNNSGNKRPYLKMQNPSMKDVFHIEGVKPGIKTVKEAICFRNGLTQFIEPKVLS